MESTAVLIPTLGRPARVQRLLDNLRASTACPFSPRFVVEGKDTATIEAVKRAGAQWIVNDGPATYASCINTAYRATDDAYLFLGADDIVFADGWLEATIDAMSDPAVGVVGTADPIFPLPDHSAHSLVRRRYVEEHSGCIDLPDTVLYPYWHGFTDHELVGVAKSRRAYLYCEEARIEHHHPGWDKLGRVRGGTRLDATYRKGNRNHRKDTVLFIRRSRRWRHLIEPTSRAEIGLEEFIRRNRGVRGALRYHLLRR